jgi:hypothetical protein
MKIRVAMVVAALLGGCASKSSEITAAYVSPIPYQSYTCQQLGMEAQAISAKAAELSGVQDQKRTNDQIATGVAIVVFWPAAFLVGGDGQVAAHATQGPAERRRASQHPEEMRNTVSPSSPDELELDVGQSPRGS